MDVLIIKSLPRASSQLWKNWKFSRSFPSVRVEHQNYYDILGLQQSCSPADIRRAFIHISKEIHPDMNQGIYSHTSFVALNEAYSVLRKPSSRSFYDARMAAGSIYEVCYDNQKSNSKYAGPNYIQWIAFIVTAFIVIGGSIITISVVGNQMMSNRETKRAQNALKARAIMEARELRSSRSGKRFSRYKDREMKSLLAQNQKYV